ncbi:MAG: hypothetical protein U0354_17565 [Candidatus Sericytochromatia bacterium]
MIFDINDDTKEVKENNQGTILNLFYENQLGENSKKVDSLLIEQNIESSKQIVINEIIFNKLVNSQKILVLESAVRDKGNIQPYLNKIITHGDDELILLIAKNKRIYHHLNSENKKLLKDRLNRNPWINQGSIELL